MNDYYKIAIASIAGAIVILFLVILVFGSEFNLPFKSAITEECVTDLKEKATLGGLDFVEKEGNQFYLLYEPAQHWYPGCYVYIDIETGAVDPGGCTPCGDAPWKNVTLVCIGNEAHFVDSSGNEIEICR